MIVTSYSGKKYCYIPQTNEIVPHSPEAEEKGQYGFAACRLPYDTGLYLQQMDNHIVNMVLTCTEQCNLRCSYCTFCGDYPEVRCHSSKSMKLSVGLTALEWLKNHSGAAETVSVSFWGGEPLLEWQKLKKMIKHARILFYDRKLLLNISTNGTLLKGDFLEWLKDDFHDIHLNITLNGPKIIHDRLRRYRNGMPSYDDIFSNVIQLRKIFKENFTKHVMFLVNYADFNEKLKIKKWIDKNPDIANSCMFIPIALPPNEAKAKTISPFSYRENKLLLRMARYRFYQNPTEKMPMELNDESFLLNLIHSRNCGESYQTVIHPGFCTPAVSKLFVDVDGNFFQCERTEGTISLGDVFAGLNKTVIAEQLTGKISNLINNDLRCNLCPAVRFCRMCFMHFLTGNNLSDIEIVKEKCHAMRVDFYHNLKFYISMKEKDNAFWDKTFSNINAEK